MKSVPGSSLTRCRDADDVSEFIVLLEQLESLQFVFRWWLRIPIVLDEMVVNRYGYPYLTIWVDCMKTTIDISDALALEAKALAAKRGTTFRAIVEQGIRCVLQEPQQTEPFQLVDKSITGNGLRTEFRNTPWAVIRHGAYEGRGG